MFLFDTDHLSLLQKPHGRESEALLTSIERYSETDFFACIVSFHEQVMGWNARIQKASTHDGLCRGYLKLRETIRQYSEMQVLDFDLSAAARFTELRSQKVRIGTMDLRIASIALTHGFIVLTRNLVDFQQVPSLIAEDWT
ncbi:MAG TPA: type II toxin-antitoxin system VapC family toxin [Planctomycetaceae bacterium]|nr:type II toxin-antitoxin system VapC family toxin [Planctomycetaceae bacterium]